MDSDNQKILGYVLLGLGLVIIFICGYNAYTVFTGASAPPAVFRIEDVSINVDNNAGAASHIKLISGADASKLINMALWYILMFFLVQVGGKVASLGTQMAKEIKVIVKAKDAQAGISSQQF
jgi:hypothetical protein